MENAANFVRYAWNLIAEYRAFKSSDDPKEKEMAGLIIDAGIKYLADYISPPDINNGSA